MLYGLYVGNDLGSSMQFTEPPPRRKNDYQPATTTPNHYRELLNQPEADYLQAAPAIPKKLQAKI